MACGGRILILWVVLCIEENRAGFVRHKLLIVPDSFMPASGLVSMVVIVRNSFGLLDFVRHKEQGKVFFNPWSSGELCS